MSQVREADSHRKEYIYRAIIGADLSGGATWVDGTHPLRGLHLAKEDIEDKSKADWLLKALIVVQITWLILTVLVRRVIGLPETQLEIGTMSFSIFAVGTYFANWWKPKDVSRPIRLKNDGNIWVDGPRIEPTSFISRLVQPGLVEEPYCSIGRPDISPRIIRNDLIYMQGDVPLVFKIMACTAMVFGGLHFLAWNFQFPSRTELILWRVASITSAVLPLISLGSSLLIAHLIIRYGDGRIVPLLTNKLAPLDWYAKEFWKELLKPTYTSWTTEEKVALFSSIVPRNFEEKLTKEECEEMQNSGTWDRGLEEHTDSILAEMTSYIQSWKKIKKGEHRFRNLEPLFWVRSRIEYAGEPSPRGVEFFNDMEGYLRKKYDRPGTGFVFPETSVIRLIMEVQKDTGQHKLSFYRFLKICDRTSRHITLISGLLYTAFRLILLVLMLTSLRSVPEGVYENTPWTRFLPSFS